MKNIICSICGKRIWFCQKRVEYGWVNVCHFKCRGNMPVWEYKPRKR